QAPAPHDGSAGIARLRRFRDDGVRIFRGYSLYPYGSVYTSGWGYGYYGPSYYYDPYALVGAQQNFIVDPRLLTGQQPAPAPSAQAVVTRPATPLEIGEYALRTGDAAEAIKQFKLHLKKNPDDASVERLMAMALLDDRKVEQAVAVLLHAYTKQPSLARDPIDPQSLSGYAMQEQQRFSRVMSYANRTKLGSAFFTACVLAQAEERFDVAKRLIDRATAEGLDKKVGDEMTMALTNR
ncbi:MAG TPA: hypothetical protein VHC70_02635, partial [Phycisphaerales bacterium]|nr:hypothetical protein [Phycisphaerales bacterium]